MPVITFKEKNINCKSRTLWLNNSQGDIKNTNINYKSRTLWLNSSQDDNTNIGEQCLETSNTNMENQNNFMKC